MCVAGNADKPMCIPPEGWALAMSSNVIHGGWGFEVNCQLVS